MAKGVQVWSGTPATNATADSNINWAEGMAPSQMNDSARGQMASVANWRDDNNGTLVTGGTSSALTLVTNQVEGALTAGYTVKFKFGTGVAAAATLAVDGLAAAPLQTVAGTNLVGGEYSAGSYGSFTYSSTGTGQWIAVPSAIPLGTAANRTGDSAAGTLSVAGVMMGLGGSWTITPKRSSRALVIVTCDWTVNIAGASSVASLRYGTGTAPVNGAALSGTTLGQIVIVTPTNVTRFPTCLSGIMTGLIVGTAYWIDLGLVSGGGGSTATLQDINYCIVEV